MKKILSLVLTLCIMLTVCSAGFMTITVSAVEKIEGSEVTWSFDYTSKTLTFSGKGNIPDYDTYEDENGKSTIPWAGCAYNTVEFGKEITGIGNYALRKSSDLVAVIIPETIKKIGNGAFSNSLVLKSVTVKNGVTEISDGAFMGCTALSTVELPTGITRIGKNTFYKCTALKAITIPDSVKTIDISAFNTCTSLETFTAPKSLETIGDRAFYCCEMLKNVTYGDKLTSIGVSAFDNTAVEAFNAPKTLKTIGDGAFTGCKNLAVVTLGENVESIGANAFDGCSALKEITLPAGIQKIASATFSGCNSLEKVLIPEGIQTIEDEAFSLCTSLKTVRIPYSVKTIGTKALGYGKRGKLISDFKVTGYDGTAAQKYAADNKIGFTSLGDPLAKSGNAGDKITWKIDENVVLVFTGSGAVADYSIYNMPVYLNSEIQEIVIDDGITAIGAYSLFGNFGDIFVVSEKVTSIGEKAIGYYFDEVGRIVKIKDFKIVGYKGTAAETYAKNNGFAFIAIVDDGSCGEKSTWDYDKASKTLTISGEGKADMNYDEASVPSFIAEGYPVEKVVIKEGIKEIAENGFLDIENGDGKITFRIPKSVTTIGDHAIGFSEDIVLNDDNTEVSNFILNKNCIIEGYAATAAETYAAKNGIDFVTLDPTVDPPATADTTFKLSDKATICTLDEKAKIIKIYAQNATQEKIMADFIIGKDLVVSEIKKVTTGTTLKTSYSASVSNTYTFALMGDANGDGAVNSADALCVLRHSVALSTLAGANLVAADLDANNNVNSSDALRILRISVGLEDLGSLYPKAAAPSKP